MPKQSPNWAAAVGTVYALRNAKLALITSYCAVWNGNTIRHDIRGRLDDEATTTLAWDQGGICTKCPDPDLANIREYDLMSAIRQGK